ncbi:kinase-like domain-containing protein [Ustulina deusta]|nr:kinase-like domain-containing protein [Ustulina deusta]
MKSPIPKLPELVRDSELETTLDGDSTVHTYYDRPGVPKQEKWKKERVIGNGGNGVVWLEKLLEDRPSKGSQVLHRAVKQITSAHTASVLQICKSELEALAKFSSRKYVPWFVQSFGWYNDSDCLWIAMEYCPLGDLQRYLIKHTRLPESDTREIISQVVKGLQFMHEEGFAHRDLKPGNILIKSHPPEDKWWVKICDMGLSKRFEGVGAGTTAVKGTPGFFAPEQLGLGGTDPRMADPFKTDIWCLGEMTFRILCGEAAFPSNDDLRSYHQGNAMFPKERLHEIGVSGLAVSFITSAMLVEPPSRLETHQAFNHEWFKMNANNNPTAGRAYASHPVLGPSDSEPKCDPYLGAEASGVWSTVSLPFRPSRTEAFKLACIERQNSKIARRVSPTYSVTMHSSDEGTPKNHHTLRQTPILQENGPVIGIEDYSYNQRSRGRTDSRYRKSRHDERPRTTYRNQKESRSASPVITAVAGAPVIHVTRAGDAEEDKESELSIESETEDMSEAMQKLIKIEDYFNRDLRPRSQWYLEGLLSDPKQRQVEYRWLTEVITRDVLLKADEIEAQGNEKIRTRRKALIGRVNARLDTLELAKRLFDGPEKEQQGVESREESTKNSQPQSQDWAAQEGIRVEGARFNRSAVPNPSPRQKPHEALRSELPQGRSNDMGRRASKSPLTVRFAKNFSTQRPISSSESSSSDGISSSDEDAIFGPPLPSDRRGRRGRRSPPPPNFDGEPSGNMEPAIRYLTESGAYPKASSSRRGGGGISQTKPVAP